METGTVHPIRWQEGAVVILDQRRLPHEEVYLRCTQVEQVGEAIRTLAVRGAPLIGIAAAYGIALAAQEKTGTATELPPADTVTSESCRQFGSCPCFLARIHAAADLLRATRPTAQNLFWAIDRMVAKAEAGANAEELLAEAQRIHAEDAEMCAQIGAHGAALIPRGARIMTVCNAGALATGGAGTALGVIRAAHTAGQSITVISCETRPLLQGARLTMWELMRDGIPATMITDSMAGAMMQRGLIDVVIAGADRIARNGDTANKIGTYTLAVLAKHHGLPFYIAAPMSTVDLSIPDGSYIPIEERAADEVRGFHHTPTAPAGAPALNPAFDVTPHELITAIITERGVYYPPYEGSWEK